MKLLGQTMARGVLATAAMSLFMLATRRLHLLGEPPPRKLSKRFLQSLGVGPKPAATSMLTTLSHTGFGAAAALPLPALLRRCRTKPGRMAAGALYGAAVWAVMYQGVLPALNLMPRPARDRPGRPTSMLLAHLIYGATLAALVD